MLSHRFLLGGGIFWVGGHELVAVICPFMQLELIQHSCCGGFISFILILGVYLPNVFMAHKF